jgi:hypothetical protein
MVQVLAEGTSQFLDFCDFHLQKYWKALYAVTRLATETGKR